MEVLGGALALPGEFYSLMTCPLMVAAKWPPWWSLHRTCSCPPWPSRGAGLPPAQVEPVWGRPIPDRGEVQPPAADGDAGTAVRGQTVRPPGRREDGQPLDLRSFDWRLAGSGGAVSIMPFSSDALGSVVFVAGSCGVLRKEEQTNVAGWPDGCRSGTSG